MFGVWIVEQRIYEGMRLLFVMLDFGNLQIIRDERAHSRPVVGFGSFYPIEVEYAPTGHDAAVVEHGATRRPASRC